MYAYLRKVRTRRSGSQLDIPEMLTVQQRGIALPMVLSEIQAAPQARPMPLPILQMRRLQTAHQQTSSN